MCIRDRLTDVGHADRLATGHVDRAGQADVGHAAGAVGVDDGLKLVEVDVALERVEAGRVVGFVNYDVHEDAAGQLLVQPGSGEMCIRDRRRARW